MSDYLLLEDGSSHVLLAGGSSGAVLLARTELSGIPFIASGTAVYAPQVAYTGQQTVITTPGTFQWLCPTGVTLIYVECLGGGGGGGGGTTFSTGGGGGGGGGAYSARIAVPVTPGTVYTFVVGSSGAGAAANFPRPQGGMGGNSTFTGDSGVQVIAVGGTGGLNGVNELGGQASSCTGDTGLKFSGGNGGLDGPGNDGGGGGASGNRLAAGANGGDAPSGAFGAGGVGANGGGSGGHGGNPSSDNAQAGSTPGGGGGGGGTSEPGKSGADGQVTITAFAVTFISSVTAVFPPAIVGDEAVPFIPSVTAVYALTLVGIETLPFISSVTAVFPPTLLGAATEVDVPFIPSSTHVWSIFSFFNPDLTFTGPGNGGEVFSLRLNANGVTTTATLATAIGIGGTPSLTMTGDSGMPTDASFVITIDSEQILVVPQGAGSYLIRQRPMGNTSTASHSPGATVSWNDSYDMAIISNTNIDTDFTADIESTGSSLYTGFLMAFDSSQAYKADGSRFPLHVTEFMGVFVAGAGVSGTSKVDGSQPSAIHAPESASDHCGAALTVPALITADIVPGDVIVVRYTNPAVFVLDLGPRSGAIQSWFGLKRVDTSDNDVTYTNPNGIIVDTKSGYFTYTGSVNTEPDEPIPNAIGIAPDASDIAGHAIPTPSAVPWLTVTLPGTERYFTDGIHYSEKGWPIGVLSCRQGNRRVPLWKSWDWHNFSYVYSGFGTDDSFAQVVINRNGMFGVLPTITLPGSQDIDGPDAVWDDGTYYFGASWYVVLVATPYLVVGPVIGGGGGPTFGDTPPPVGVPVVTFPSGGGGPPVVTPPVIEGGSGGDIAPSSTGLNVWQIF